MYRYILTGFTLVLLMLIHVNVIACEHNIYTRHYESSKDRTISSLLSLALSKTDKKYCVKPYKSIMSSTREIHSIRNGELDVIWSSGNEIKGLKAIKLPIYRGMLGYRIFVIAKDDQHKFNHIQTIEQLSSLKAGSGMSWGDTIILKNAGLPVLTAHRSRNLWTMLENNRFDYFPLALHEPWEELEKKTTLTDEKTLLIHYPTAMYFYVNENNQALYNAIAQGMQKALNDGSYNALFYQSKMIQSTIKFAQINKRRIIEIPNSTFYQTIPQENIHYWFSFEQLKTFLEK